MAELGRRELINDPLAITGRERPTDRSLDLQGVRAPNNGGPEEVFNSVKQAQGALDNLDSVLGKAVEKGRDEMIIKGKQAYLSGATEAEMLKQGDRFYANGYRTLQARDNVNNWFTTETVALKDAARTMAPEEYNKYLNEKRKSMLDGIEDPDARRVAVAAFEDLSPRLAQQQLIANNDYNHEQRVSSFTGMLGSTAQVSLNASRRDPDSPLAITANPVETSVTYSDDDRDASIKTILGEAVGEGSEGMAAVAHVMRNRMVDGRFPTSLAAVARQDKQFSVWNDGGKNLRRFSPGNPLYDKAGKIFDAVMAGRHVDPTGGATHYYSPEGMKAMGKDKPDWFDGEAKAKGGAIRIGGHIFAGKAAASNSAPGVLDFGGASDKIDPDLKDALAGAAGAVGGKLKITSGYRDPGHNSSVGGAKGSRHMHGDAADLDMSGMDDAQRLQLVRELRGRGLKRFITYTNSPNMLHVDMSAQNGDSWFMYDKSNANMDKAPAWFKEASGEDVPKVQAGSGTEVQGFIRGYAGLNDEEKATAVADEMRRRLDSGDPSLFTDGGGLGMLQSLKAKPSEIDEVIKAKQRYDASQQKDFNVADERYRNDILARAEKGEDLDTVLADIEKRNNEGNISDEKARSLAQAAADKIRAAGSREDKTSKLGDIGMLSELGGLYQKLKTGSGDFVSLTEDAQAIAKKYGASEADVKNITSTMFQIDQSRQDELRSEAKTLAEKAANQQQVMNSVSQSLGQGYGLNIVSGAKIKVGQKEYTPQEYGIQQIKDKWAKFYTDEVSGGKMSEAQAKQGMLQKTYLELQKQGVVDQELQAQLQGGLTGNILDPKRDIGLKEGAVQAFDAWKIIRETPGITPGYMSKVIEDPEVRGLLETAYMLDSGDLSPEQSLIKAHEMRNDVTRDPNDRVKKDLSWVAKRDELVRTKLDAMTNPSFFESLVTNPDLSAKEQVMRFGADVAKNYVTARSEVYHLQNTNEAPEVSLEKAMQDLSAHSSTVAGNLIITKPNREISKVMGVQAFGERAPDEAFSMFLSKHGEAVWKENWAKRNIGYGSSLSVGASLGAYRNPARVKITYNPDAETVTMDLWDDEKMKKTIGDPKTFYVKDIAKPYIDERTKPSGFDKAWDSMFDTLGQATKDTRQFFKDGQERQNAAELGSLMGTLAGQK